MEIINADGQKITYRKIKEYKYFFLYENVKTGTKECFLKTDFKNGILKPNAKSNTGIAGVCATRGYYQAYIYINHKQEKLGTFKNIEDAIKAREKAEKNKEIYEGV